MILLVYFMCTSTYPLKTLKNFDTDFDTDVDHVKELIDHGDSST